MLRVLVSFLPNDSTDLAYVRAGANVMFLIFSSGLTFLLIARWQHDRTLKLLRAVFGKISPAIAEKVVHIVDGFVGALRQLPDWKNLAMFLFFTAGYWVLNGFGLAVLSNAFPELQLNFFQGMVLLSVLIIGLMIPAAPGSAGTFQAFIVLGLGLFLPKSGREPRAASPIRQCDLVRFRCSRQIAFGLIFDALVESVVPRHRHTGKLNAEPAQ